MRFSPSDLRGLAVFRSVIENGGFTGAQLALGMSQSTLSFHLKALEERVGFELCRRGRRGFQLTEKGREVFEASKSLVAAVSSFESRLGELRKEIVGTLRVGVVANTVSDPKLPIDAVMEACLKQVKDAEIELLVAHPQALVDELSRDGIDIALTPPMRIGPDFREKLFYHEMHSLYCSHRHPLFQASKAALTPETISRHDFIVRSYANKSEINFYPEARVRIQSSTMEAQAILILSGRVIGYLPEHFARQWEDSGQMRRLNSPAERYASPLVIVSKLDQRISAIQRLFIRELTRRCVLDAGAS
ncbi:LysR family transcriptional regulator [Mesorhizobium sp. SP-1A]|uniref:LysR family transcriptional regulator n=1 Tax=Mesorhizobium sp. SP-1A TaxID=3077840 RepID=UPI0028F718BE|nr:LysR family transcriptional regulator [Mesorhizobium sp. SP-1A]